MILFIGMDFNFQFIVRIFTEPELIRENNWCCILLLANKLPVVYVTRHY